MSFSIKTEKTEKNIIFYCLGDLDINTSPEFKKTVIDEYNKDQKDLVFNFKDLEYLDSTGLGVLISVYKNTKENQHTISIRCAKPHVKKLFVITELDRIFKMEEDYGCN